jgi:CrcB protein
MTYVYVALGGGLGSMARFWMAGAMARLTGPLFPWGTILINVLGSFAIGAFASAVVVHQRIELPADARVFVMVGLCGGFTTFSSFSLQTLDLARGGRMDLALANAALSLAACLAAVAAGHYGAAALLRD